jgi:hypothetical protein
MFGAKWASGLRDVRKATATASAQSAHEPPRSTFSFPCAGPSGSASAEVR